MKPFNSSLAEQLEAYVAYRRDLGFTDKHLRSMLRPFDRFMEKTGLSMHEVNPLDFMDFKKSLQMEPRSINAIIIATRGFFDYLIRIQLMDHNPLKDFPLQRENAFVPFIFSPSQTKRMLRAIYRKIRHNPKHFFNDLTVYTAIFLLAQCGMRLSEPLRLKHHHYRKDDGTVYIEKTKFRKDRLIALSSAVIQHLNNYLSVKETLQTHNESTWLLPAPKGGKLRPDRIYAAFHQALDDICLKRKRRVIGNTVFGPPTPHSLRHSFAVNTLHRIRSQGQDPQSALPILSAYMGHRKYRYTAVYLKFTDANQRQQLLDFSIKALHDI
ncbi:MAG: tyrosine-type recombinase/integrase [Thermodesulfobacteriota bacterium]|nr:tyrosine-type recombinase/integrase [Thermodesulfobacteriota bacterium]